MDELSKCVPKSGSSGDWYRRSQENYKGTGRYDTRRKKKEIISHNNSKKEMMQLKEKEKKKRWCILNLSSPAEITANFFFCEYSF